MIRYALRCACGHGFDAWFACADAFDAQAERGLVDCPSCGANTVAKAPMAPAIRRRRAVSAPVPRPEVSKPAAAAPEPAMVRAAFVEMVRELKRRAEPMGERFAEEARRIHRGEVAERAIWGQATGEEAKALWDDGIDVAPLPDIPDHDA